MKNIYIVNKHSRAINYGIGTFTKQLVKALKRTGGDVTVVTLYCTESKELEIRLLDDVRYIDIPISSEIYNPYFTHSKNDERYQRNVFYLLSKYICVDAENIFHLNFMELAMFTSVLKQYLSCKVILHVHYTQWSFDLLGDKKKLESICKRTELNANEILVKKHFDKECFLLNHDCDKVIAIADHANETLRRIYKVDPAKLVTIPNGLADSYKQKSDVEYLRNKYGLRDNECAIIFVGRLDAVKGVHILIKAFKEVLNTNIKVRLFIVGEGNDHYVRSCIKETGPYWSSITFTGFLPKRIISELYQISSIGVVPSIYEEFGFVATEMLMHKLPIIVNKTTGLKEIVSEGENGVFVKLDYKRKGSSSKYLASKITELLNDEAQLSELKKNSRKSYLKKYTRKVFENNILKLYSIL